MAEKSNVPAIATGSAGILLLTLLFALGGGQSTTTSDGSATTKKEAGAASDQFAVQSARTTWDLLRDFYGMSSTRTVTDRIGRVEKIQETLIGDTIKEVHREGSPGRVSISDADKESIRTRFKKNESRVVIATVPDPRDGHVSFKFDEAVEVLQNAAQDAGWVLDRFSFNWPARTSAGTPKAGDTGESDRYRREPSVILFRSSEFDKSERVLLMFLVGETPTAGVHKIALQNALDQAAGFIDSPKRIAIIGPNYSGTFASLQQVLQDELPKIHPDVMVDVVTGSATSTLLRNSFARSFRDGLLAGRGSFYSTVWSDDIVQCAVFKFLDHVGISRKNVALLVESDSAYGAAIGGSGGLTLRFPMHISLLRSRYQNDQRFGANTPGRPEPATPSAIEVSSEEADNPQDLPPAYTPLATDNLAELAINNIVSSVASREIKAVGFFATDPRDKLFLGRLVRSVNPDVVLFTSESDLLYAHPDFSTDLYGSLVFSTFPLSPQTQIWSKSDDPIRQFTSQAANGIYTAMYAALTSKNNLANGDSDFVLAPVDQSNRKPIYGPNFASPFGVPEEGPLLWVSSIGRNMAWPIDAYRVSAGSMKLPNVKDELDFTPPRSFTLLFILGSIGCWVAYALYTLQFRRGKRQKGLLGWMRIVAEWFPRRFNFPTYGKTGNRDEVALWIVAFFVLLLVLYSVVSIIAILPSYKYLSPLPPWAPGLAMATSACLVHAILDAFTRVRTGKKQKWWIQVPVGLASAGLIFVMIGLILPHLFSEDSLVARFLLYDRAIQVGSGVSPLAPLAFLSLGLCTWIVCALKRLQLLQYIENVNPFPMTLRAQSMRPEGFARFRDIISASLQILPMPAAIIALVIFLIIGLLGWFGRFGASALDGGWLVWPARIGLVALVWTVVLGAVQFLTLWFQLRRLLLALSVDHLRDAFKRIPHSQAHGLGTFLTSAPPTLVELGESLRRLKTAIAQSKDIAVDFQIFKYLQKNDPNRGASIKTTFEREIYQATGHNRRTWAFASRTQRALAKEAQSVWKFLRDLWDIRLMDGQLDLPVFVHSYEEKKISETVHVLEEFVAIQIVSFLSYVFQHLRLLLTSMIVGVICLMLAVGSYPFRPLNLMMNTAWFVMMCVVTGVILTLGQMKRNEILIAIAQDGDGNTNWDRGFLGQMIFFGALPLLSFLASKFPALGNVLFSWFGPALRAFHIG